MSQDYDLKEYEWRFYIKNDEVVGSSNKTQGDITGPPHDRYVDRVTTIRDVTLYEFDKSKGTLVKKDYNTALAEFNSQ